MRIRSSNSDAGSSFGFCGTISPRNARASTAWSSLALSEIASTIKAWTLSVKTWRLFQRPVTSLCSSAGGRPILTSRMLSRFRPGLLRQLVAAIPSTPGETLILGQAKYVVRNAIKKLGKRKGIPGDAEAQATFEEVLSEFVAAEPRR